MKMKGRTQHPWKTSLSVTSSPNGVQTRLHLKPEYFTESQFLSSCTGVKFEVEEVSRALVEKLSFWKVIETRRCTQASLADISECYIGS